jgi:hypothetical protein
MIRTELVKVPVNAIRTIAKPAWIGLLYGQ